MKGIFIILLFVTYSTSVNATTLTGQVESNNKITVSPAPDPVNTPQINTQQTPAPHLVAGMPPIAPPRTLRLKRPLNGWVNDSGFRLVPGQPQLAISDPSLNQETPLPGHLFPASPQTFSPSASGGQDEYWVDWETWRRRVQHRILIARIKYEICHLMAFPQDCCFSFCVIHNNGNITNIQAHAPTTRLARAVEEIVESVAHKPELEFPAGTKKTQVGYHCILSTNRTGTPAQAEQVVNRWKN